MRRALGLSFAKVNLFLRVLKRREDGYHEIEGLLQNISLHDCLYFQTAAEDIKIECSDPAVPLGTQNLCHRAASAILEEFDIRRGLRVYIDKRVPMGAGLGGGSSNAACTLLALNAIFSLRLSPERLCEIGAQVGSDVPSFLMGGAVLARGRGEQVESVRELPKYWFLIVKPDFECETAQIYELWDENPSTSELEAAEVITALRNGNWETLPMLLKNDLEPIVIRLHPEVEEIKAKLVKLGAKVAFVSGSGSAVVGIFPSRQEAAWAYHAVRGPKRRVFLARSVEKGVQI